MLWERTGYRFSLERLYCRVMTAVGGGGKACEAPGSPPVNPFRALVDYAALQRRFCRYTTDDIRRYQWREIEKLLALVRERSAFYRDLYRHQEVRSLAEFAELPTIDKAPMMENFDQLNPVGLKRDELVAYAVEKELTHDYFGYYAGEYVVGCPAGQAGPRGSTSPPGPSLRAGRQCPLPGGESRSGFSRSESCSSSARSVRGSPTTARPSFP